jgi:glycosyltransferase involved in cell wall biosynthesis
MKAIFLRGAVPPEHEHPEKLLYDTIENCEDVWTQLFYYFLQEVGGQGELLYKSKGQNHEFYLTDVGFKDKWVPSFKSYKPPFEPDVIICRGGFPYYDDFVKRFPNAKKVYYGAGRRYWPTTDFTDYDLFLVDDPRQRDEIKAKGKKVDMLLKPAATMFRPHDIHKRYDICFMANAAQRKIKRHDLFIKAVAKSKLSVLNLGNTNPELIRMAEKLGANITWAGWSLRRFLPEKISQCRVGVCASGPDIDSCPRVIPEYLACGLPVITTDVKFWQEKYIAKETGYVVPDTGLVGGMELAVSMVKAGGFSNVREYYDHNLGMKVAAKRLADQVREICG